MSRSCKLQINAKGAWRDALSFDIDQVDGEALQVAAANLVLIANPSGKTTLRIAVADGLQTALLHWSAKNGWVEA
ncbi:MAG: hypothetical protein V4858_08980 [Pseudomonadota bacterium]